MNHSKEKADLIITNAKVYTVNKAFDVAEAFAVKNGEFIGVGTNTEIIEKFSSPKMIDLDGNAVYPGFIDGHCHFYGLGLQKLLKADLVGTVSYEDVLRRIRQHSEKIPEGWLQGRGWDQNDWENQEFPDRDELDGLFPDRPVLLIRIDGHAALANAKALEMAGIDKTTKVEGGEVRMENGRITGILIDNAINLVTKVIPEPSDKQIAQALKEAENICFSVGLTSVVDAGLDKKIIASIDSLQKEGKLKMRINAMISPSEENLQHYMQNGTYRTPHLTVNSVKMYADGALGSRGALLIDPYSDDPDNRGLLLHKPEYFNSICEKAYNAGYQVNMHAIGDSAVRFVLGLYSKFLDENNDRRWRVEHAQIVHPDDFGLFGQYNIIPSVQSTHATSDMYWAEKRIGPERIKGAYAFKDLLQENGWLVNGTDFPIERVEPVLTFFASVVRKDLQGFPEDGFQMENALSRKETLKSMTIWAAKGSFEEDFKGSIEPGKMADFVVTDRDLMTTDVDQIPETRMLMTFSNGKLVYEGHRRN